MPKLFVYGTLRKEECRNSLLKECHFIGYACARGFNLYDLGSYPGMISGNSEVIGEVYEIPEELFQELDEIEGTPYLYKRELINVILEDYSPLLAYTYIYNGEVKSDTFIPSGDWKKRR